MAQPTWFRAFLAFAIIGLLLSVGGMIILILTTSDPDRAPGVSALPDMRVPDFDLVDAAGEAVDASIFDGRVTVLDFFFTNCPLACPGMTRAMRQVQDSTDGRVRLVSISVDPVNDTPEALRRYAEEHGADRERWDFLTGEPGASAKIVREGLNLLLQVDDDLQIPLEDGATMSNIIHPTRLILVGPDRRVQGFYSYSEPTEVDRLIEDATRLARSPRGG